jgi:hypothetical protein
MVAAIPGLPAWAAYASWVAQQVRPTESSVRPERSIGFGQAVMPAASWRLSAVLEALRTTSLQLRIHSACLLWQDRITKVEDEP